MPLSVLGGTNSYCWNYSAGAVGRKGNFCPLNSQRCLWVKHGVWSRGKICKEKSWRQERLGVEPLAYGRLFRNYVRIPR